MPVRPARLPRSAVRRTYTWIAPIHDGLALLVEEKARQCAFSQAAIQDGETVLEVAVGTGLNFNRILQRNPNGWTEGVDLTPAMLKRAARRAEHAHTHRYGLRIGDAYRLDFPDDTFDCLLNSYMFDILPEDDFTTVLQEFKRVLKPGGRLVMINMTVGDHWYNQGWELIYRVYPPLLGGCRGIRAQPYLDRAGFANTRRTYITEWTFPSEVVYGEKPDGPSGR